MKIRFKNLMSRVEEVGEQVSCRPGEKIILQGQPSEFFFFIKTGRVEVHSDKAGKDPLTVMNPGEYFGEITCLTGDEAKATYVAADGVTMIRSGREGLLGLMGSLPEFNQQVVDTLCGLIRLGKSGRKDTSGEERESFDEGEGSGQSAGFFRKPRIGLALGAGVVRGMAHIGVIRSLKKNNIPVDLIAGTSAGALVGACLAAGVTVDQMEDFALRLRWSRVATPVIPPGRAFLNNEKLGHLLNSLIGDKHFRDLAIPLAVVAADAGTGEEVIISEGKISDAVRASTAIPAIFEPVSLFNRTLVDGGSVNMVPASVCRAMGADIVIAVSVSDFHYQPGPPKNIVLAILRTFDMALKKQVAMAKNQWADVVIDVKRPDLSGYNFRESGHFIREGERKADRMMPAIKTLLGQWKGC